MINDLDYEGIEFLFQKNIIAELKDRIIFELMYSVIKIIWLILFMYQIKSLIIVGICC